MAEAPVMSTPSFVLPERTFRAAVTVPPMVVPDVLSSTTPAWPLGLAPVPKTSVPTRLP